MHGHRHHTIYQIYPLGFAREPDSPHPNPVINPLAEASPWIEHLGRLGCDTLQLGPIWYSEDHGYDTIDYFLPDPRLGSRDQVANCLWRYRDAGIRVVLDGVFNHSSRRFFAFQGLLREGPESSWRHWYKGVDFSRLGKGGTGFHYSGWRGYDNLPEYNLDHPEVRQYFFQAVETWIRDFGIQGLRLDAADCLSLEFMASLGQHCRRLDPDFWMMAEVIHGEYSDYVRQGKVDSVTNYEAWKSLWSSIKDRNFHELAWTLERQFVQTGSGTCRGWLPVTFTDNHDVSRSASLLDPGTLVWPLWSLAFTIPGQPSIYYGSEVAWTGIKAEGPDWNLRPALDPAAMAAWGPYTSLQTDIARLARLRQASPALREGDIALLHVEAEVLCFLRRSEEETLLVCTSIQDKAQELRLKLPADLDGRCAPLPWDLLNGGQARCQGQELVLDLYPRWTRVFRLA